MYLGEGLLDQIVQIDVGAALDIPSIISTNPDWRFIPAPVQRNAEVLRAGIRKREIEERSSIGKYDIRVDFIDTLFQLDKHTILSVLLVYPDHVRFQKVGMIRGDPGHDYRTVVRRRLDAPRIIHLEIEAHADEIRIRCREIRPDRLRVHGIIDRRVEYRPVPVSVPAAHLHPFRKRVSLREIYIRFVELVRLDQVAIGSDIPRVRERISDHLDGRAPDVLGLVCLYRLRDIDILSGEEERHQRVILDPPNIATLVAAPEDHRGSVWSFAIA